ncbi:MAG: hypothetical protein C0492_01370 [Verminephrobacter sp.]|nr:hypothetical protein [Verminephrobacter sp.]
MQKPRELLVSLLLLMLFLLPASGAFAQSSDFYTDCEKYPGSLGCLPVGDAPAPEQVPSETRTLELLPGPVFGGGGCPANLNVHILGRTYTVLDMAQPCAWIVGYMKPIILLMAAISAVFIVMPRES